jgi:hypothetical protein
MPLEIILLSKRCLSVWLSVCLSVFAPTDRRTVGTRNTATENEAFAEVQISTQNTFLKYRTDRTDRSGLRPIGPVGWTYRTE